MNPLAINSCRAILLNKYAKQTILISRKISGCFEDKSKCPKRKITQSSCKDNKHKIPPRELPKKEEFKSMWESPKCDISLAICPEVRFDQLYYKPSDKAKRVYQQTWVECAPRQIKEKVVCEFVKGGFPPLERRKRGFRPDTAKCLDTGKGDLMQCSRQSDLKQNKKCLKIGLPGCRTARSDIKCKVRRGPANCEIPRCPYPSFSECTKPCIKPKRPSECECLKIRSMCEVWTILRQKAIL